MLTRAHVCIVAFLFCCALTCSFAESINYAEVRTRVSHAFAEKAHEMTETLAVLQDLSKATSAILADIHAQCKAHER